ncbi:MFS transporter [Candidatus Bathyarchaeota archaeon]|nr:MFS transporter [Candidatus Bathyarchaeota archaeon]
MISTRTIGYSFWTLCVVGFFAILSSTMSKNPVLNPFARSLNTPDSLMGFVAAASTIPGILVSLPAGSLSDIFGRRKILFVSVAVFASAPFLYLLVTSWWHLALVRFYHGFATAMFVPVTNAYVAELFPSRRAERISLFSSVTTVGRTIAPFLGGYVLFATNYGFHQLYLVVGIAGFTAFITALLLLREPRTTRKETRSYSKTGSTLFKGWIAVARNPKILVVTLVEAAQYYAFGTTEFFLVGYLKEVAGFDSFSIGVILGSQLAIIPLLKPLMGRLSDKIGRRIPIVLGSLASAFTLGLVPFTAQFHLLILISILYGVGFSMVTGSTPALISELADETLVGTGMGFLGTIMDVGQTLGPIITGFILATNLGYIGSFSALTLILLGSCAVFAGTRAARNTRPTAI